MAKQKINARCPRCGKEFFSLMANNWDSDVDETLYCSEECMKADGITNTDDDFDDDYIMD